MSSLQPAQPPLPESRKPSRIARFFSDYGTLPALILLCVWFAWVTTAEQRPAGAEGGRRLASQIAREVPKNASVLIVTRDNREDVEFAAALKSGLEGGGFRVLATVQGEPSVAREALQRIASSGTRLDVIACSQGTATWAVFDKLEAVSPILAAAKRLQPHSFRGSNFLKTENLLNIANQIAVIAIIAIGMTLVIITGGIDLSVGSLIALSAVVAALLIRNVAGAERATPLGMVCASLVAIGLCGLVGLFSGAMTTFFKIPAFIVTLAMMLVGSGFAFILSRGQSIYQVPEGFVWLGRGSAMGLPNSVILMLFLYVLAHYLMTRTKAGRYIYAVGSNAEAVRLSGVSVQKVLLFVYLLNGLLAGLGGVVMASQLRSGAPTYGQMYELYVIAAVVVGGTSLAGGQGKVFGTLLGAFIIAVIQNGMNLTGIESYTQKVALGLVILGAVALDTFKQKGAAWMRSWRR